MPSQPFSRKPPSEGYTIARQAMEDAADFYLAHGGPAVARAHVEKLANELKFYDDSTEAYCKVLERIDLVEKAEQQQAELSHQRDLRKLMEMMMGAITHGQDPPPANAGQDGSETKAIVLTPKLSSPKAMQMWQRLQQEGYIDDNYQPVGLTRTEVALLAEEMTIRLSDENDNLFDIKEWKPYETLWHRSNMKADHQRARIQAKTPEFRNKLKTLFAGI